MNVALDTYRNWDQGKNRPSDPATLQLLAAIVETPLDVLYPLEENPHLAGALHDHDGQYATDTEGDLPQDAHDGPAVLGQGSGEARSRRWRVLHRRAAASISDRAGVARRRWCGRIAVASGLGLGLVIAVAAIIVLPAGQNPRTLPGQDATSAVAAQRSVERVAMQAAVRRGDYDTAITIAKRLSDGTAAARYRAAAARVLVKRADLAAGRGELALAKRRLVRAQKRYGLAPGADQVRAHVTQIQRRRKARNAQRRADARQRASRSGVAGSVAPVVPPATSTVPVPPKSSVSPSSGSGSGSSGGSSSPAPKRHTVDPGLF